MATQRAYWRGYMRLSLVTFPVRLYSALDNEHDVRLRQIHKPTGERIRHQKVVPELGAVEPQDIVMGYEYDKDQYVLLDKEDLKSVALESSETIELSQFIDASEIDDIYVDKPFYVVPAGKNAVEAYEVLRRALKETGKAGLGELVVGTRERIVAVRACGRGLRLETLRYADEIKDAERYFDEIEANEPEREMVTLAEELIRRKTAPFEPERFRDDYETALRHLIDAKLRGITLQKRHARKPSKIVDLMRALKDSVEAQQHEPANLNRPTPLGAARGAAERGRSV